MSLRPPPSIVRSLTFWLVFAVIATSAGIARELLLAPVVLARLWRQ